MNSVVSIALLGVLAGALPLLAEVKLARIFSDHMVLQREMAVPVWGTADPGEKVEIEFRGRKKSTTADATGKWRIQLDALTPGGPDVLKAGAKTIQDVLVGDVWFGSGQSNMAINVNGFIKEDPVLAANAQASYPRLRLLKQEPGSTWQEATPARIAGFSAMLFSFGMPLQKELDIPVGLMMAAAGGTPSGYWLSEAAYRSDAPCAAAAKSFNTSHPPAEREAQYAESVRKYEAAMPVWQAKVEQAKLDGKPVPQGPPKPQPVVAAGESSGQIGNLYERWVRPWVGYGIKGVLWDQGEAQTNIIGVDQYTLMGALIRGWRKEWAQGDFPFLYIQKPSGGGTAWDLNDPVTNKGEPFAALPPKMPGAPASNYTHEMHLRIMAYPKTYMVTTTDLGRGTHPTNKSGYGARAARVALATVYGRAQEYYGPLYASHKSNDGKLVVTFTHVGKGLTYKPGEALQGFAIAGEDQKFVWADAQITGDSVVLSSKEVPAPTAARYAWNGYFPWANLFNKDGLPAQPFRTDSW